MNALSFAFITITITIRESLFPNVESEQESIFFPVDSNFNCD